MAPVGRPNLRQQHPAFLSSAKGQYQIELFTGRRMQFKFGRQTAAALLPYLYVIVIHRNVGNYSLSCQNRMPLSNGRQRPNRQITTQFWPKMMVLVVAVVCLIGFKKPAAGWLIERLIALNRPSPNSARRERSKFSRFRRQPARCRFGVVANWRRDFGRRRRNEFYCLLRARNYAKA